MPADPHWPKTADSLNMEQQGFVKMAKYSSSGLLWGKCSCCDKWINGPEHFASRGHLSKAKENSSSASSAGWSQHAIGRSPEVKVLYPTWHVEGFHVDGVFLVESFFYEEQWWEGGVLAAVL